MRRVIKLIRIRNQTSHPTGPSHRFIRYFNVISCGLCPLYLLPELSTWLPGFYARSFHVRFLWAKRHWDRFFFLAAPAFFRQNHSTSDPYFSSSKCCSYREDEREKLRTFQKATLFRKFRTIRKKVTVTLILAEVIPLCYNTQMWPYEYSLTQTDLVLLYLFTGDRFRSSRPSSDKLYYYYYYLFFTCNWVDTRWLGSLHVTLARTIKILL